MMGPGRSPNLVLAGARSSRSRDPRDHAFQPLPHLLSDPSHPRASGGDRLHGVDGHRDRLAVAGAPHQ